MILPMSSSVIFNHPADVSAAIPALASEDESFPLYFCRLQDNPCGPKASSTEDITKDLLLCPLGDCLPASRSFGCERIRWMDGLYHVFFSLRARADLLEERSRSSKGASATLSGHHISGLSSPAFNKSRALSRSSNSGVERMPFR